MARATITAATVLVLLFSTAGACFDVYLFQREGSMVYPKGMLSVESLGEYSYNSLGNPDEDSFMAFARAYYGVSRKFSVSVGTGSEEKPRGEFSIDAITASGTFNLIDNREKSFSLDGMLACHNTPDGLNAEVSFPVISRKSGYVFVFHPVVEFLVENKLNLTPGFHAGVFKVFAGGAVVGMGAEFHSGQQGPYFSKRLTDSETAASLFLGAMLGKNLFLQNEIAKGLHNSRDLGFAITLKILIGGNR
ncbi:MAG TPA: hypothetical protein ENG11_04830 [candidate division Zixibacteria bacterium]|nr:hypothetical protein [candidate division Zixibacteria bacterium]